MTGLFILALIALSVRIIRAYERGVVFRLGKAVGERGPGLAFVLPIIDRVVHVDMRVISLPLEQQEVITKDNVSLTILAVIFYRVIDATKSEVSVEDYEEAIEQFGQTAVRKIVGRHDLDEILHSETVVSAVQSELAGISSNWGIEITNTEIKDNQLPENLRRAMAATAEAKREADAKVTSAEGERRSAAILAEAAAALDDRAMRLRELQIMREIGTENNTVIVVPSSSFGESTGAAVAGSSAALLQQ
jgi:regulator of protease activity HflC (stomatin/prohibitin superfamily)